MTKKLTEAQKCKIRGHDWGTKPYGLICWHCGKKVIYAKT